MGRTILQFIAILIEWVWFIGIFVIGCFLCCAIADYYDEREHKRRKERHDNEKSDNDERQPDREEV